MQRRRVMSVAFEKEKQQRERAAEVPQPPISGPLFPISGPPFPISEPQIPIGSYLRSANGAHAQPRRA
eukprot:374059-Rhodomonas_salina.3